MRVARGFDRRRVLALVAGLLATCAVVVAAQTRAAESTERVATAQITRCGYIHASVPYSRKGSRYEWGVYTVGKSTCGRARTVLSAVMHLRGTAHNGSDNADSYLSYQGWRCDFGQMGSQACWTPARRPYQAQALALNCDDHPDGGCPVTIPRDYL